MRSISNSLTCPSTLLPVMTCLTPQPIDYVSALFLVFCKGYMQCVSSLLKFRASEETTGYTSCFLYHPLPLAHYLLPPYCRPRHRGNSPLPISARQPPLSCATRANHVTTTKLVAAESPNPANFRVRPCGTYTRIKDYTHYVCEQSRPLFVLHYPYVTKPSPLVWILDNKGPRRVNT